MAGFYGRASDVIVEISECHLLHPALMKGLDVARELALLGASRKAALAVTVTVCETGLDVAVRNGKPLDGPLRMSLANACQSLALTRLAWDDDVIAMESPPAQTFGQATVVPPPGSFLQATLDGECALLNAVKETVNGSLRIADLFSGSGTFALPLAESAAVHAVEGDAGMIDALDRGWRMARGLKPVTTEVRDLFRRPLLPDELAQLLGFRWDVTLPAFVILLIAVLVGVLLGFVWEWVRERKFRVEAATERKERERLEREVKKVAPTKESGDDVLALLEGT